MGKRKYRIYTTTDMRERIARAFLNVPLTQELIDDGTPVSYAHRQWGKALTQQLYEQMLQEKTETEGRTMATEERQKRREEYYARVLRETIIAETRAQCEHNIRWENGAEIVAYCKSIAEHATNAAFPETKEQERWKHANLSCSNCGSTTDVRPTYICDEIGCDATVAACHDCVEDRGQRTYCEKHKPERPLTLVRFRELRFSQREGIRKQIMAISGNRITTPQQAELLFNTIAEKIEDHYR